MHHGTRSKSITTNISAAIRPDQTVMHSSGSHRHHRNFPVAGYRVVSAVSNAASVLMQELACDGSRVAANMLHTRTTACKLTAPLRRYQESSGRDRLHAKCNHKRYRVFRNVAGYLIFSDFTTVMYHSTRAHSIAVKTSPALRSEQTGQPQPLQSSELRRISDGRPAVTVALSTLTQVLRSMALMLQPR